VTINFHWRHRWGKETCLKAKKCSKFCRHASLHELHVQINFHAKAKAWVFTDNFYSHFIGCGLTNHSRSWIQLWSNTAHYHFCILKSGKLLWIRDLLSGLLAWGCTDGRAFVVVGGGILHQKGLGTLYTLIFHSEATYTLICVFVFHFKSQRSNFYVLGMKARPWKCVESPSLSGGGFFLRLPRGRGGRWAFGWVVLITDCGFGAAFWTWESKNGKESANSDVKQQR